MIPIYQLLAARFANRLAHHVGQATLAKIDQANKRSWDHPGCASHTYCDANLAMFEAFSAIVGHEVNLQSSGDRVLWKEAWDYATLHGFDNLFAFVPGDRVKIRPEVADPGDSEFVRTVIETPADSSRVLVRTTIPNWEVSMTNWTDVADLILDLDAP